MTRKLSLITLRSLESKWLFKEPKSRVTFVALQMLIGRDVPLLNCKRMGWMFSIRRLSKDKYINITLSFSLPLLQFVLALRIWTSRRLTVIKVLGWRYLILKSRCFV